MTWISSPSCFPPHSLLSACPLLFLPVCFHERVSSCLCSLRCWLLTYDLRLAFSFLLSPHGFPRIPPVGSFLVYERLRTKAQAKCLSPPLLLSSAHDDTDDRDRGLPMDPSSDLGSPDPLPACLGSLVCKMDIMTDREQKKQSGLHKTRQAPPRFSAREALKAPPPSAERMVYKYMCLSLQSLCHLYLVHFSNLNNNK